MMTYDELRMSVKINVDDLSIECSKQPVLFLDAAEQAASFFIRAKAAKHNYEVLLASAELKYKNSGEKITDKTATACAVTDPQVVEAKEKQLEAEELSLKWQALESTYEQRRTMLSNEVALSNNSQYDIPSKERMQNIVKARTRQKTGDDE